MGVLHESLCGARALALAALLPGLALAQYPDLAPELGTDLRVETDDPGVALSTLPRAAATAGGVVHLVWQDLRAEQWAVHYRRIEGLGAGVAGSEQVLSDFPVPLDPPLNHMAPRIATDGDQALYVAWHAAGDGVERLLFVRSLDGGLTWSSPGLGPHQQLNHQMASEYAGEPEMVADGAGRVWVAWAQSDATFDQIYMAASSDFGATFSAPVLSEPVNLVRVGHREGPRLATDGQGNLYLAWMDHRDPQHRNAYLRRSSDHGATWQPGETLLNTPGTVHRLDLVAQPADLSFTSPLVLAAWIDIVPASSGVASTTVKSNWSTDGGASFLPQPRDVSLACQGMAREGGEAAATGGVLGPGGGLAGGGPMAPPGLRGGGGGGGAGGGLPGLDERCPSLFWSLDLATAVDGNVMAAYSRTDAPQLGEPTRVLANAFSRETLSWGSEQQLSRAGVRFPAKGQLPTQPHARVATDGSRVYVVWMHSGEDYQHYTDVNVAWSLDGGASWSRPSGVSTAPGGPGAARAGHPQVVALEGQAAIVWDDRRHWTDHQVLPLPPGSPLGGPDIYLNVVTP